MIRKLIRWILAIPRSISKLIFWVANPKNGTDYVTPFNRHYLSTGASLTVAVLYRFGIGVYEFLANYVLGSLAYLFNAIVGVMSDLWHANPKYSRWVLNGAVAVILGIMETAIIIIQITFKAVEKILKAIFRMLR